MKETDLLYELFDCNFNTTEMVDLSKKIRQSAYELMLYEGPDSAAAAGAMLGLAKEAKFLCCVLDREDISMDRDFYFCHDIRSQTLVALDMLLQETSNYGHVSWALVVAKPEKPRGTVGYLNYASDNGDVNVDSAVSESVKPQSTVVDLKCASDNVDVSGTSAGAKPEKPEGTVGYLNCKVMDSMEGSKGDLNDCCEMDCNAKFGFTINKDHKLEEEHLDASYLWKVTGCVFPSKEEAESSYMEFKGCVDEKVLKPVAAIVAKSSWLFLLCMVQTFILLVLIFYIVKHGKHCL